MFVTFTYLFFFVDVDLRSVCVWTLPWIRFALDATVRDFRECFEKSLHGCNLLLTIQNLSLLSFHGTSDSPPMKGYFNGLVTANVQKVLEVHVRCCACVYGEMYLLLVRGVSRSKTLIPLILSQSGWIAFITIINN